MDLAMLTNGGSVEDCVKQVMQDIEQIKPIEAFVYYFENEEVSLVYACLGDTLIRRSK